MSESIFTDGQIAEMKEKMRAEILRESALTLKSEMLTGLIGAGISKDDAEIVINAVATYKVPHMRITY